jgi:ElaB/YqjD/DUF883 family membrane-anchored ribosome-binding protein
MTDEEKKRLKTIFNSYSELSSEIKEISKQKTDLVKEASDLSKKTKSNIRKAFAFLMKKEKDGGNELDEVNDIIEEMI